MASLGSRGLSGEDWLVSGQVGQDTDRWKQASPYRQEQHGELVNVNSWCMCCDGAALLGSTHVDGSCRKSLPYVCPIGLGARGRAFLPKMVRAR